MGNRDRFLREADSGGGWHPVAPVHSLFRQYIYILLTFRRRRRRRRINTFNVRATMRVVSNYDGVVANLHLCLE